MLGYLRGAVALLALAGAAGTAQAELVSPADPQAIADIVKSQGRPAELVLSDDSNPMIRSEHHGIKFLVLFMNCKDDHTGCKTLQYYMGFTDAKDTTLEQLNEWNGSRRFARAYRDDDGDPVLEMDVDVDFAGLPRENIGETFNTWTSLMDAYRAFLFD